MLSLNAHTVQLVTTQDALVLDAVLTVVDSRHITSHLDEEKPDGVVNEAIQQVAFADKVCVLPPTVCVRLSA
jgi:G3E family GTPase